MPARIRLSPVDLWSEGSDAENRIDLEVELRRNEAGERYLIDVRRAPLSVEDAVSVGVDEARWQVGDDDLEQTDWSAR